MPGSWDRKRETLVYSEGEGLIAAATHLEMLRASSASGPSNGLAMYHIIVIKEGDASARMEPRDTWHKLL